MPLFTEAPSTNEAYCNIRDLGLNRPVRDLLESAWSDYEHLVPDRAQFEIEFRSDFHARAWELLLIRAFCVGGLALEPPPATDSPDIRIRLSDGRICWVECVVPRPGNQRGIPTPPRATGRIPHVPEEPTLLRYTSVLTTKFERIQRYVRDGRVDASDLVFVAVYSDRLPLGWVHDAVVPAIAKVLFGFGDEQIAISIGRSQWNHADPSFRIDHRDAILNDNGSAVPCRYFADPGNEHISGVITARDYIANCDRFVRAPLVVIHNPLATAPAPRGLLPCRGEMWVEGEVLRRTGVCSNFDAR